MIIFYDRILNFQKQKPKPHFCNYVTFKRPLKSNVVIEYELPLSYAQAKTARTGLRAIMDTQVTMQLPYAPMILEKNPRTGPDNFVVCQSSTRWQIFSVGVDFKVALASERTILDDATESIVYVEHRVYFIFIMFSWCVILNNFSLP